jgi:hypothetical protein
MSIITPQNRNRLIAIAAILIVLMMAIIYSAGRSQRSKVKHSQIGSRHPAAALPYCSMDQSHLCVLSFGQIVNGPMRVDFLAPNLDYPEFVLKVINNGEESTYDCQSVGETPENIYCTGRVQAPGAILELSLFSKKDNALLAKGTFSVIGVALLTPEFVTEASSGALSSQLGFRIPEGHGRGPLSSTPTFAPLTPFPTSYPNPSYP